VSGLRHQALAGAAWTAGSSALQAVFQVAVLAVLARLLTPLDFGTVGAAMVIVSLGAVFAQFGVGPALVQRAVLTKRHLEVGLTVSLLLGTTLGALVWAMAGLIEAFFRIDDLARVVRALALAFPLKGLSIVSEALLQRDLRFRPLAATDFASYAIGYGVVGVSLAVAGYGVWALVGAFLVQAGIRSGSLLLLRPPELGLSVSRPEALDLLTFGTGHTAGAVGAYLSEEADNLIVGRWLGASMLGIYGRAFQFLSMPARLFGVIADKVLFPVLAKARANTRVLSQAYVESLQLIGLVTIPAGVGVSLLAPEIVATLLGPGWDAVVIPLQLLALSLCFRTGAKLSKALARATGAVYRSAWRQWVFAVTVATGAYFGQRWGLAGVAAAVLLVNGAQWIVMLELGRSLSGARWGALGRAHVPSAGLAAGWIASGVPLLSVLRALHWPDVWTLAVTVCVWMGASAVAIAWRPTFFMGHAFSATFSATLMPIRGTVAELP
jgi:O-antigen/teichoic acid export membrane protein